MKILKWDQKCLIWVLLRWTFKKLLSCLKSISINFKSITFSQAIFRAKMIVLKSRTNVFEEGAVVFEINNLEVLEKQGFLQKQKS